MKPDRYIAICVGERFAILDLLHKDMPTVVAEIVPCGLGHDTDARQIAALMSAAHAATDASEPF